MAVQLCPKLSSGKREFPTKLTATHQKVQFLLPAPQLTGRTVPAVPGAVSISRSWQSCPGRWPIEPTGTNTADHFSYVTGYVPVLFLSP